MTGTAAGMGRAIAQRLAEDGVRVAMLDINAEGLGETQALSEADGRTAMSLEGDVTGQCLSPNGGLWFC